MSDEKTQYTVESMFESMFGTVVPRKGETPEEYTARKNRECVPEEFASRFTVVDLNQGIFGGGIDRIAACNRCGALVYPTALDRHVAFHDRFGRGPHVLAANDGTYALCGGPGCCEACDKAAKL
jgi:hypothetical protein